MAGFGAPAADEDTESNLSKDKVMKAIDEGDGYVLKALRDATKHTVFAQSRSILINGLSSDTTITHITPWWMNALTALRVISLILLALFIILYYVEIFSRNKIKTEGGTAS